MPYDSTIPSYKLKMQLLHHEHSRTKFCKFYENGRSLDRFMSFCRFYWSQANPLTLCSVLLRMKVECEASGGHS